MCYKPLLTNRKEGTMKVVTTISVKYNDLKLLKQLTTHAGKENSLKYINFVVEREFFYAWTTDAHRLAIIKFSTEENVTTRHHWRKNDESIQGHVNRVVASVRVKDFNAMILSLFKNYKKADIDGYATLSIYGNNHEVELSRSTYEEKKLYSGWADNPTTSNFIGLRVDNTEYNQLSWYDDKSHKVLSNSYLRATIEGAVTRNVFKLFVHFINDEKGSLDPDKRRPIVHMAYDPKLIEDAMKLMKYNKDDHFIRMYTYLPTAYDNALFFDKTCSGDDSATWKKVWIMRRRDDEYDVTNQKIIEQFEKTGITYTQYETIDA
tara:strand:- start:360 stop:1319 length:960 start_codon:yes stop_codon:yes gene_type:complete